MLKFSQWLETVQDILDYDTGTVKILVNPDAYEVFDLLYKSQTKQGKGLLASISPNAPIYVWNDDSQHVTHDSIAHRLGISRANSFHVYLTGEKIGIFGPKYIRELPLIQTWLQF